MPGRDFRTAVARCWTIRAEATRRARDRGSTDPGLRAGATSGKHLDPLAELVETVLLGVKPPWLGYVFLMQDEPAALRGRVGEILA
jgi:hypothetical protein